MTASIFFRSLPLLSVPTSPFLLPFLPGEDAQFLPFLLSLQVYSILIFPDQGL